MSATHRSVAKDFFLLLLSTVTLYLTATSVITILFQYVNHFFPDTLNNYYYYGGNAGFRFAISMLIVVFPVYLWSVWYMHNEYKRVPSAREYSVRKWLTYFTLFVATFMIIGSLISTVNNFLSGELTVRFLLKAMSVAGVAGVIFTYYLLDIRDVLKHATRIIYRYTVISVVVIMVVGAFFIMGSPSDERERRMDTTRMSDLINIKMSIDNFYMTRNTLPESLEVLNQPPHYFGVSLNDPDTRVPYEYTIVGEREYELCAVFSKNSTDTLDSMRYRNLYPHQGYAYQAGRYCFSWSPEDARARDGLPARLEEISP